MPETTSREIRLRISKGNCTSVVARNSCAANSISARCSRRSTPEGSDPTISTATTCACSSASSAVPKSQSPLPWPALAKDLRDCCGSWQPQRIRDAATRGPIGLGPANRAERPANACQNPPKAQTGLASYLWATKRSVQQPEWLGQLRKLQKIPDLPQALSAAKHSTGRSGLPDCCTRSKAARCCASQSLSICPAALQDHQQL